MTAQTELTALRAEQASIQKLFTYKDMGHGVKKSTGSPAPHQLQRLQAIEERLGELEGQASVPVSDMKAFLANLPTEELRLMQSMMQRQAAPTAPKPAPVPLCPPGPTVGQSPDDVGALVGLFEVWRESCRSAYHAADSEEARQACAAGFTTANREIRRLREHEAQHVNTHMGRLVNAALK